MEHDDEFEAALADLVQTGRRSGVDPRGAWISRGENGQADFEIEIVELADG